MSGGGIKQVDVQASECRAGTEQQWGKCRRGEVGVSERRDSVRGYGGTKLQHTSMSALKSSLVPASPAVTRGSLSIRSCTSMDSSLLMSATNAVRAAGGLERTKRQAVGELASPKRK